jgi:hypothetical protein
VPQCAADVSTLLLLLLLLQDEYADAPGSVITACPAVPLCAADASTLLLLLLPQDEYADAPGSVITADFYGANELLPLTDDEVVARVKSHLEVCSRSVADPLLRVCLQLLLHVC